MSDTVKYFLPEDKIPKTWYNIVSDMPNPPAPVIHPGRMDPVGPDDLAPLFPMEVIKQEVSQDREVEIPQPVREIYKQWRPSPLFRAHRLEKALDTPAKIFYKYEGVSPAGSHKPNTAIAQAFYAKEENVKKLTTETGAGQWGSSLSLAGAMFGLEIEVFMVKVSFQQKPYRRAFMESFGANCVASPSNLTEAGKKVLSEDPDSTGSLGIAISEAVEKAAQNEDTKYSLGSVLNHVLLHQTVIGQEAILQLEMADAQPDIVIGCTGGGSNFAGIAFPFLGKKLRKELDCKFIAAEPNNCPTLTKGKYTYDFGDTIGMTPLVKMHTLGSKFVPPGFHAGGLRYHGMSPLISQLVAEDQIEARSYKQTEIFDAGTTFAKAEGILPAPEANHAISCVFEEAKRCKEEGKSEVILFNLCGHGYFDMQAYMDYSAKTLTDDVVDAAKIEAALAQVPEVAV